MASPLHQLPESPSVTALIPNWNGEDFIVRCVSSALHAARECRQANGTVIEILVVDDASTDRSVEILKRECPGARLIVRSENGGFATAVNQSAMEARGSLLVLLNSDMAVRPDFFIHLLAPMGEPDVFAVTAKTVNWSSGEPNHVNMTARLMGGQVRLEFSDPPEQCETLFLQGGAAVVRRDVFNQVGGFAPLYHPGYWEDYDLSLRAVKAGWRIVYEPKAIAHHLGKASLTTRLGNVGVRRTVERNRLLFSWQCFDSGGTVWLHCLGLPLWVAKEIWRGDGASRLRAFVSALRLLPQVVRHRRLSPPPQAVSDVDAIRRTAPPRGVDVRFVPNEI